MTRVYKYSVPIEDGFHVLMPISARPLSVGLQDEQPVLWALVNDEERHEPRRFAWRGTGHAAKGFKAGQFVGTVQFSNGLVFHLFDLEAEVTR